MGLMVGWAFLPVACPVLQLGIAVGQACPTYRENLTKRQPYDEAEISNPAEIGRFDNGFESVYSLGSTEFLNVSGTRLSGMCRLSGSQRM